ncbi:hypothetical protein Y032_0004g1749 [Ancylostoma ceylanicum]|uniref:Uncharacterized protein n=1 Tax=Ancylostoma ceylanicum TaxID=53326 RepID=A0A016VVG0_9BILA|nr:hypothetical protein Y032_0004g1749 [Ancylostoma ceylanicum]
MCGWRNGLYHNWVVCAKNLATACLTPCLIHRRRLRHLRGCKSKNVSSSTSPEGCVVVYRKPFCITLKAAVTEIFVFENSLNFEIIKGAKLISNEKTA